MHYLKIANIQPMKSEEFITVFDALTNTPEISISLPENITFPVTLGPKQRLTLSIVVTPENLGHFQGIVYVLIH